MPTAYNAHGGSCTNNACGALLHNNAVGEFSTISTQPGEKQTVSAVACCVRDKIAENFVSFRALTAHPEFPSLLAQIDWPTSPSAATCSLVSPQ